MACEHCGRRDRTVMVPMQPGADGKPWQLCVRCWAEGAPAKQGAVKGKRQ